MLYSNLSKSLKQGIQESAYFYSHTIQKTSEGIILIDKQPTSFKSLSEAKSYIRYNQQAKDIINTLHDNFFSENTIKIANIIKEEHNIKVSNNIIEQYIKIASDKAFSIDPLILKLREMNEYDAVLFLPDPEGEDNQLKVHISKYKNPGEKVGGSSMGDLFDIIIFRINEDYDLIDLERFDGILVDAREYISRMIKEDWYGYICRKTTTSEKVANEIFDNWTNLKYNPTTE